MVGGGGSYDVKTKCVHVLNINDKKFCELHESK